MHSGDSGSLRAVIELDASSGRFELDEQGYTRFIPSKEKLAYLNRWIGDELDKAAEAHKARFAAAAENVETYKPTRTSLPEQQGRAILPSPLARMPADQIIANTVNNVLRPRPIISFDAYFAAKYPVLVPMPVEEIERMGYAVEPEQLGGEVPVPMEVDSETLARRFEQGVEFHLRERMGFASLFHRTVHNCVTGASPSWIKVCWKRKQKTVISPKVTADPFVDTAQEVERDYSEGGVHWYVLPFYSVLRPNITDAIDDLDWIGEDAHKKPDEITRAFEDGEYFLIRDAEHADKLSKAVSVAAADDTAARLSASTQNYVIAAPVGECDVWEIQFYAYLKVTDPNDAETKPKVRRFALQGDYHRGTREFMSIVRNPYNHQKRNLVPFTQFLDGSSTVEHVKHAQQLQTHLSQAEIKSAYHANNPLYWYDPNAYLTAPFFSGRTDPITPGTAIPGKESVDWGIVRGGFEHYSLLGLMQWNAGTSQEASKISDYDAGNRVVSHTSPSTVQQMLERGGQNQVLFLHLLNNGIRDVIKLYLETSRQFKPMGEEIPVRDPKTKQLMMVPYRYPVGDVLDNFRISLTAADEAIARERDAESQAILLDVYQRHTTFVAQVVTPMLDEKATPELIAFYRKIIEGEQAIMERIIGPIRTDEEKFDVLSTVDAIVEERALARQQMEAMNAANPGAAGGGAVPQNEPSGKAGGSAGAGAEPAMAGSATGPTNAGVPPPV